MTDSSFTMILYVGVVLAVALPFIIFALVSSLLKKSRDKQEMKVKKANAPLTEAEKFAAVLICFLFSLLGMLLILIYYRSTGEKLKEKKVGVYCLLGWVLSLCAYVMLIS